MIRCCGTCQMFWQGECWGYANRQVSPGWLCDSFSPSLALGPVTKAETTRTRQGTVVHVAPHLQQRSRILAAHLEREIGAALMELGEQAGNVYQSHVGKARPGLKMLQRLVAKVMAGLNIPQWIDTRLLPILRNQAARTTLDTQRVLQAELNLEVRVADQDAIKIAQTAADDFPAADIERQVRQSILVAVHDGLKLGENPMATARRIRRMVPAGRFVNAGSAYRSQLIARDQTAKAQRAATLSAYESNDNIVAVRLRDGIYGPPRSDSECIARDGEIVPIANAGAVHAFHPLCTLGFEPVVSGVPMVPTPEPIAA